MILLAEKLAIQGIQDEGKTNKICVGHYYAQTNTNNGYNTNSWRQRRNEHRAYAAIVTDIATRSSKLIDTKQENTKN